MIYLIILFWLLLSTVPAHAITQEQLNAVLDSKYPDIGTGYYIKDGQLIFNLWLDRATKQPSTVPKPTLAQVEAWLPDLPA